MTVNAITANVENKKRFSDVRLEQPKAVAFAERHYGEDHPVEKKVKYGVIATTILGVASALAIIAKKQGFSLNPKTIAKTLPKDWAIFKTGVQSSGTKILKLEEPQIIGIALGSVTGGLAGGAIFDDKKHLRAKLRESVNQLLGNILTPLVFVSAGVRLFNSSKLASSPNKTTKGIAQIIATIVSLGAGIFAGNGVSNFINAKIYKKEIDRDIKATDMAPHVDDLCLASSLMADGSKFGSIISKFIAPALTIAGYEVGTTKDGQYDKKRREPFAKV